MKAFYILEREALHHGITKTAILQPDETEEL